jgi:hypothetical protein
VPEGKNVEDGRKLDRDPNHKETQKTISRQTIFKVVNTEHIFLGGHDPLF